MLLVRELTGPSEVATGDMVTYRVTEFNVDHPSDAKTGRVNWLVRPDTGTALTNVHEQGPKWTVTIPTSWASRTIYVMPYMRSATQQVSVQTRAASVPAETVVTGDLHVRIAQEGRRYYTSINDEPRFYVGTDVSYGPRRGLMNSQNPYGLDTHPRKTRSHTDSGPITWSRPSPARAGAPSTASISMKGPDLHMVTCSLPRTRPMRTLCIFSVNSWPSPRPRSIFPTSGFIADASTSKAGTALCDWRTVTVPRHFKII